MNTQRKVIVILVPGFPESEADSTCLPPVQNYAGELAASGLVDAVEVIAFQYPFRSGTYNWRGLTVHALGGRNRRGLGRLRTWIAAMGEFLRLYGRYQTLVIHSFWLTECTFVGGWLSRLPRVHHVASIGGQDARADNPFLRLLSLDRLVLTAGSEFAARTFSAHSPRGVDYVIPLGLDVERLKRVPRSENRDIDVIGAGSLIPLKNYGDFIQVIGGLVADLPELRALIIGEGPERPALERLIAENGLQEHVRLTGELPRAEVIQNLFRSKIFLHTARFEGQGYVLLEALYAGLSIVCFDVGYTGAADNVFRCDTVEAMQRNVRRLLMDTGSTASPNAPDIPTIQDTVRAFADLYQSVSRARLRPQAR